MGLFDRFKKRFKKSAEEITVEEDSVEAEQALEERRELIESLEDSKPTPNPAPQMLKPRPKQASSGMISMKSPP
jgi:hypothetical protein